MQTDEAVYLVEEARTLDELRAKIALRRQEGWQLLDDARVLTPTRAEGMRYAQTIFRLYKETIPTPAHWRL
jgi:hypothetical protein